MVGSKTTVSGAGREQVALSIPPCTSVSQCGSMTMPLGFISLPYTVLVLLYCTAAAVAILSVLIQLLSL